MPWYNLLHIIEGDNNLATVPTSASVPNLVFAQWKSSDTKYMIGSDETAISTTNVAQDFMTWKAQRTNNNDRFVIQEGGIATFTPILICLADNGCDTNNDCE